MSFKHWRFELGFTVLPTIWLSERFFSTNAKDSSMNIKSGRVLNKKSTPRCQENTASWQHCHLAWKYSQNVALKLRIEGSFSTLTFSSTKKRDKRYVIKDAHHFSWIFQAKVWEKHARLMLNEPIMNCSKIHLERRTCLCLGKVVVLMANYLSM